MGLDEMITATNNQHGFIPCPEPSQKEKDREFIAAWVLMIVLFYVGIAGSILHENRPEKQPEYNQVEISVTQTPEMPR